MTSRCHASEALRRCARCRQADEQNRLSLRPLRTFPHPAHDLDGPSDAAPVVSCSRCRSRRIDRAEASRWSTIHGSACTVISVGGSWRTGQPTTMLRSRLAGTLRAMRATLRMLAVTARQGVGRMTIRRLPPDLAALVAASLLVESEPGVFRKPTALHTARLPSRAELHADAAAPENGRGSDHDPRPVRLRLSP